MVGILYYENDLKENLILECPKYQSFRTYNILEDLINRASDYLTLAEFISNFDQLFTPDAVNELKEAINELKGTIPNHISEVNQLTSYCDNSIANSKDEFAEYKLSNSANDLFNLYIITDHCMRQDYDLKALNKISPYVNDLTESVDNDLLHFMIDEISKLYFSRKFDGLDRKLLNTRKFKKLINIK